MIFYCLEIADDYDQLPKSNDDDHVAIDHTIDHADEFLELARELEF